MNENRTIYFDMDGTIADLYGVENWLEHLRAEEVLPYEVAAPLVETSRLAALLTACKVLGYRVGVISWVSKVSLPEYTNAVRSAKLEWLRKNLPIALDEVHIVKYGTRKDYIAKDKNGIIFDDDVGVRVKWRGLAVNPNETDILSFLCDLIMGKVEQTFRIQLDVLRLNQSIDI